MTTRKPLLPMLDAVLSLRAPQAAPLATKELRAAEDVLRALDAVQLVPSRATDRLIAAVARLDKLTRPTQRTP